VSDYLEPRPGDPAYVVAPMDATHIILTRRQFNRLPDYSCSLPTGVVPGKTWRRRVQYDNPESRWVIGRYDATSPTHCRVVWRELLFVEDNYDRSLNEHH
jgi:hypothetical protein